MIEVIGTKRLPSIASWLEARTSKSLGFLRPAPDFPVALLASGPWLRLRTPFGSIALRGAGGGLGNLAVTVGTA